MVLTEVVPVVGVPFINSTRSVKTLKIVERTSSQLVVEMSIKSLDAPYCDTFLCEEVWIVTGSSSKPQQERCVLQQMIRINFVKYTMFKSKINARALEGMK